MRSSEDDPGWACAAFGSRLKYHLDKARRRCRTNHHWSVGINGCADGRVGVLLPVGCPDWIRPLSTKRRRRKPPPLQAIPPAGSKAEAMRGLGGLGRTLEAAGPHDRGARWLDVSRLGILDRGAVSRVSPPHRPIWQAGVLLRGLFSGSAGRMCGSSIRVRSWDRGSGHVVVAVPAGGGEGGRRSCERRCDVSDLDGASERSCWIPVMVGPFRGFDVVQESSIGHCAE